MNDSPAKPETIGQLLDAVYPSFALLAGMELDLFTPLADGRLSVEQLAAAVGVQPVKLRPLLYALVVAGLLTVEDDLFGNTSESDHYLVRGQPAYLGGLAGLVSNNWFRILDTAGTIRAGEPLKKYDYHGETEDEMFALFRGLNPGAAADAQRLMERYDFAACGKLLDIGGGAGGLAVTLAQANPQLEATIIDLPSVTPLTRQLVDEAYSGERVKIVTADAVQDRLSGSYDVVVVRHVIQVLSEADGRALLQNVATVLKPGGKIHLIGWILDDSRLSPPITVGLNLVLLNGYKDGQAYTEKEYRRWLDEAGFVDHERFVYPNGASILTAQKRP